MAQKALPKAILGKPRCNFLKHLDGLLVTIVLLPTAKLLRTLHRRDCNEFADAIPMQPSASDPFRKSLKNRGSEATRQEVTSLILRPFVEVGACRRIGTFRPRRFGTGTGHRLMSARTRHKPTSCSRPRHRLRHGLRHHGHSSIDCFSAPWQPKTVCCAFELLGRPDFAGNISCSHSGFSVLVYFSEFSELQAFTSKFSTNCLSVF